ncbi:MAG: SMP-30/gluconolactonase/LRE family protein [Acidobacteria bacterium]|nr:SMP-30/gluconolactonase/LRE family protein [Acidobacteriota bacterium]
MPKFPLLALLALGGIAIACDGPAPSGETPSAAPDRAGAGTVLRVDPRLDRLVPSDARIEKLADGFMFTEGPVWVRSESRLLFSEVRDRHIYQWSEAAGVGVFRAPWFEGDLTGRNPTPNGLTIDREGRLIICEHGNRVVSRIEADGARTILADRYEGRRLNSPNDIDIALDGTLYFTDPSYGLDGYEDSPLRELDYNGVYRLHTDGRLELLAREEAPNGIALSPDEATLYVANTAGPWKAYDLGAGGATNERVFHAISDETARGGRDGLKVDLAGNVYATGPGGVWVLSPDGAHLGTISPDEAPANVAWGDDGRTLYITARTGIYRIRLTTEGRIPGPPAVG